MNSLSTNSLFFLLLQLSFHCLFSKYTAAMIEKHKMVIKKAADKTIHQLQLNPHVRPLALQTTAREQRARASERVSE